MSDRRVLPHDTASEASILGGVFLRNDALAALPELEPEAFYDGKHKAVFQAMRNLEAAATPIDATTVEFELARVDKLEACGGPALIGELVLNCPTADNVRVYADTVIKLHRARQMAVAASEIVEGVYAMGWEDADEYIAQSERRVLEVSHRGQVDRPKHVGDLVRLRAKELDEIAGRRASGDQAIFGIPTGVAVLDEKLGGLPRKVPVIYAGRPKMGKSSAAMAAADAASAAGIGVMTFSLEDGREAFSDSLLARHTGVPTSRLRTAELERQDMTPLARGFAELRKRENWRFDERVLDATTICRELRRAKAEIPNFGLGVVDYVQLVRRNPRLNEDQAIRETMAAFAAIAKELDIALIVVSQLNRKLEEREDKRPTMADLRGSGALEEIAKLILFFYRGSEYSEQPKRGIDYDCEHQAGFPCRCAPHNFAEQMQIIIGANSMGQTGRVFAHWNGPAKRVS